VLDGLRDGDADQRRERRSISRSVFVTDLQRRDTSFRVTSRAVEHGHLDVEQDDRDVVLQQLAECLLPEWA